MRVSVRLVAVFSLCLVGGLAAESLLVLRRQSGRFAQTLREDFRVLVFLQDDVDASKRLVLEEKLRALPDVEVARYVSRDESLAELRRDEPELAESVTFIGDNPLPPAFEVRLAADGLARFPQWLAAAGAVADWGDVRYRPGQVRAVLQARFYEHYLSLALSTGLCAAALAAFALLWRGAPKHAAPGRSALPAALAGSAAGIGLACLLALPMRDHLPWWSLPPASTQLALLAGLAAFGWLISPWIQE